MQSHGWRCAGEAIHFGGVGEFLFQRGGGSGLHKLAEARAGVGESPGGNLNLERIQNLNCMVEESRIQSVS